MVRRVRLDAELVRRGLARSRQHAGELIATGRVSVNGVVAGKAATQVETAQPVLVKDDPEEPGYASRGGHKLAGALDGLGTSAPRVSGRRALDAGASTGGFTDVLLRRGAAHVVAVDVGYGQLVWELQNDPRVTVMDRTNVRTLDASLIDPPVELVVGDLSFISLGLGLPALAAVTTPDADLLLMVKPQFEVGKDRLGSGGVVRDPELHVETVLGVVANAGSLGLGLRAAIASPLPGPSGNVEYLVHLRHGSGVDEPETMVRRAVRHGPAEGIAS
ncbi:TlyA family RNA methyltransferase [Pseudactinotalea sp.]|uniref:TlyA family RNA methyltransferase n=1 Tax=Pseudactinotalea sp. TaxID=1926260 RepID=UPI003B3B1D60